MGRLQDSINFGEHLTQGYRTDFLAQHMSGRAHEAHLLYGFFVAEDAGVGFVGNEVRENMGDLIVGRFFTCNHTDIGVGLKCLKVVSCIDILETGRVGL